MKKSPRGHKKVLREMDLAPVRTKPNIEKNIKILEVTYM
jgi:hypothetical protein